MDKVEEELFLGGQAAAVLDNAAYQAAWKALLAELERQRNNLPATDKDGAQALILCERMAHKFKSALDNMLQTGKFASEQLRIANEKRRWFKSA